MPELENEGTGHKIDPDYRLLWIASSAYLSVRNESMFLDLLDYLKSMGIIYESLWLIPKGTEVMK